MEERVEEANNDSILPHSLWGLDPLFYARVKLNVLDIMQLKNYQGYTGVWQLLNHPIVNVCILGDVQQIDHKEKFIIFYVDDGTECIGCKWNKESSDNELNIKLGDLVRVLGRVTEFNGKKDIDATVISKEQDPNSETLHWLETLKLKKTIYCIPFQLPQSYSNSKMMSSIYNLKTKLLQYLNKLKAATTFTHSELVVCAHNASTDASDEIVDSVLRSLENEGYILCDDGCEDKKYQFIPDKLLFPIFLSIFKKYKDSSISIMTLHQELIESDSLKYITTQKVQRIIAQLIDDNYIYPTDEYHYQIVG